MTKYDKSMIYKICCKDLSIQDIYIGSTLNFRNRKYYHKNCCVNENNRGYLQPKYEFIRNHGGWENWEMILIKEVSCNNIKELQAEERKTIEEFGASLNSYLPNRNQKERYEINKETINKQRKEKYNGYDKQDKPKVSNKLGIRNIREEEYQGRKYYTFEKKGYKRKRFNRDKYTLEDVIEYKKSILNI